VQIDIANNQVKLTFADIELISKLVEGKFPDFNRVIPKGYKTIHAAANNAALAATRRHHDQRQVQRRALRHHTWQHANLSTNADQEEAMEELEIDYGGDTSISVSTSVICWMC
jgi:DNA polymerase-3 subunit beta